jgi:hypothetical protein
VCLVGQLFAVPSCSVAWFCRGAEDLRGLDRGANQRGQADVIALVVALRRSCVHLLLAHSVPVHPVSRLGRQFAVSARLPLFFAIESAKKSNITAKVILHIAELHAIRRYRLNGQGVCGFLSPNCNESSQLLSVHRAATFA